MIATILVGLAGGVITGVSPCVLPMLPIVFVTGSNTDGDAPVSGWRTPAIIAGIVTSFSVIALLGTVLLSALGLPDSFLRWTGIVLLVLIGVGMIVPGLGHLLEKPFARIPGWHSTQNRTGRFGPYLLGLGLGTLYVPCAGPVLAAIAVAGATGHIGWSTVVLTVSFAIGAALPLALFVAAGQSMGRRIAAYRNRQHTFRVIGGVILIGLAVALAFDAPARLQTALPGYTAGAERALANSDTVNTVLGRTLSDAAACNGNGNGLADCGTNPGFEGGQQWFNTANNEPLTTADLNGKVVLVDFWTYSCINCLRDGPHVRAWYDAYRDAGLVVVGVHSPEFSFEKDAGNVATAIGTEHITYPVVQDNNLAIWQAFNNRYWPAKYLIDATGKIRAASFGEGRYDQTEANIRELLTVAHPGITLPAPVDTAADHTPIGAMSPEMYLNPERSRGAYAGTPALTVGTAEFTFGASQPDSTYALDGQFTVTDESVVGGRNSKIRLASTASNVNAVLGGAGRIVVHQDGHPDRTIEVAGEPRLYRIAEDGDDRTRTRTFEVSQGVAVYTFTFG